MRGFCSKLSAPSSFLSTHFGWGWQAEGKWTNTGLFRLKSSSLTPKFGRDGSTWRKRAEHLAAANVHQKLAFFCSSMETCSPSEYERHHLKPHTRARAHTHEGVHYQYFLSWQYKEKGAKHGLPGKMPCVRHPAHRRDLLVCRHAPSGLEPGFQAPRGPGCSGQESLHLLEPHPPTPSALSTPRGLECDPTSSERAVNLGLAKKSS